MSKLIRFFSYAAMTQVILLLNQVVLLPIQIRSWGTAETATWYAAIALATLTTVADLGLRNAGHLELLQLIQNGDSRAKEQFREIWRWLRLLICLVTLIVICGEVVYGRFHGGPANWDIARTLLTLAFALETLLIVRIVYLDSLGEYSGAESGYFAFAAMRLAVAVPALLVFKMGPAGLGGLFLGTSVLGLMLQGRLCRIPESLSLFSGFSGPLSMRTCSLARYTVAEPCANWIRLSLPVLVIAAIAPATAVTTYVALRAVYGAGRTTVQQVARVSSVEYLRLRAENRRHTAESLLCRFMLAATLMGTALAAFVTVDNLRLLSFWLKHYDRILLQNINLSFAATSPFYAFQVMVALSFRTGRLAPMAHRQYAYVLYSALFACIALASRMLPVYLGLLVIAEILLAITFLARKKIGDGPAQETQAGLRGLAGSFAGLAFVLILWMAVRHSHADFLSRFSPESILQTLCMLTAGLGLLVAGGLAVNADLFHGQRIALGTPDVP